MDDHESLDSPVAVKWGATENAEVFAGWSPFVRSAAGRASLDGVGDLVIGSRLRFKEARGKSPSAAIQFTTKIPLAESDSGLGTGLVDFFVAAIATSTIGSSTVVGFYQLGVLSDPAGGDVDASHGIALAWSHSLARNLGGFVEVTGILTPSVQSEEVFTIVGLGYNVAPTFVVDAAGLIGLTPDAPDYVYTAGLTWNVGRLF